VLAPVVSVTKEVPQSGVTNNNWDVNSTTENYTRLDSAYATTLDWAGLFDISTASFVDSFSVSAQDTSPHGMAFNTDGTKMFVAGLQGLDINEYTLSSAFDVSTASFVDSFSVSSQDSAIRDVAFNTDGTKMFVLGDTNDSVFQYTLSTGFDVSTASYDSVSFSVTTEEINPSGMAFNTDGTKMFILGRSGDDVGEYALTTGFDISTASFTDSFFVGTQETGPEGIAFNNDGTKMFIVGEAGDDVNRYTLTTGFDVSTASFTDSFSIAAQEADPTGIAFSSSGDKMFIIGLAGDDVNEYSMDVTLALGTGSFVSADVGKTIEANSGKFVLTATDGSYVETTAPTSYDQVASGDWSMYGVVYNAADGDLELSGTVVNTFDVSTAVYSKTLSVASQETEPTGIAFNTDGTKMFIGGEIGDDVNEYTLSIGFDISTATFVDSFSVSAQETTVSGIAFNTDGTKMFIVGEAGDDVNEYTLSTGFDVSTASYTQNFSVSSQDATPTDIAFNAEGTKMFIVGLSGDAVYEYTLSTGFDVSTASYVDSFSVASQETAPHGLTFNNDGTKMFVVGKIGTDVNEYALATGFDVSTASFTQVLALTGVSPVAIAFNTNGTKMFLVGNTTDSVYEYNVGTTATPTGYQPVHTTASIDSTYWTDINSMTAEQNAGDGEVYYAISTDDRTTWTVIKNGEGERNIVRNNGGTWQYNTAVDVTGGSLTNGSYLSTGVIASQAISDFMWRSSGTVLFLLDNTGDSVRKYTASTAYDMSTLTLAQSFSVAGQEIYLTGMYISEDGLHLYVCGNQGNDVNEYTLTSAFDLTTASFTRSGISSSNIGGIFFSSDGTKFFRVNYSSASIWYWSLSTAWDISTASFVSAPTLTNKTTGCTAIAFNSNGTLLFVNDNTDDKIYSYTLSTGWDVSTLSYSEELSFASQTSSIDAITFNADLTNMYLGVNDDFYKYSTSVESYTTSETWTNSSTNTELASIAESMSVTINQMDKTQLDAVTDPNHIALGDDLDLAIVFNMTSGTTVPSSDGVAINYDANVLNKGAVLGADYDFDAPAQNSVRITALTSGNFKVRVV
jgi:6-phosphogluconolactonase (cycloisomerase 2 family)